MIRILLSVRREKMPSANDFAPRASVTAEIDARLTDVLQLVQRANENEGKIHVTGYRDVKLPSAGEEEEVVKAEIWGGSFLVFESAARKCGGDAGHPYLVLCQAARELGAAGSRPLFYSVEVV